MNLIVVLADDLGWNDVGYHGGSIPTPNIDGLAKQGVRNEQFYSLPICTPSRAATLTGRYPFRYGLQQIVWPWNAHGLDVYEKTMPDFLREHGYSTYCVGKWNLGHQPEFIPTKRGFDMHLGCYTGGIDHFIHTSYGVHDFAYNGRPYRPSGHSSDLYTNKACEIISGQGDKPFFMYLAYNAPHLPYQHPSEYEAKVAHIQDPNRKGYTAMVMHLDDCIGRLVQCVKDQHKLKDTILWFTSDNGGWVEVAGDNGPLKGGKIGYEEGGIRVVNFVVGGGLHPFENKSVGHLVDVFPTSLSLLGLPAKENLDGIDQTPYLKGGPPVANREIINGLFGAHGSIRRGDWKYTKMPGQDDLFNIAQDPYEKSPVDDPQIKASMEARMEELRPLYVPDPPSNWTPPNGLPPEYPCPHYWGEHKRAPLSKQSVDEKSDPLTVKEVLGYHPEFKI